MLFDIASADTWVAMTMANCTPPYENTHPCPAHRRYFHPSRSSTFEKVPNTLWSIEFSDKSKVFGNEHTDMMQIGGHVLDRQVFGVGKALYGTKDDGIDGSVGLGLSDLKTGGETKNMSPLENLAMQDGIMPLVGIWLGSGGQGGEIIFGGNDKSRHSGELSMFDIPEGSVYWSVPVHSLLVVHPLPKPSSAGSVTTLKPMTTTSAAIPVTTSGKIPPAPAPGMQVNGRIGSGTRLDMPNIIFDTSSDLILLPPRVAASTHRYIHNSFFGLYSGYNLFTGLYTVPCTLDADIYFDIGARTVDNRSPLAANSTSDSSNNDNNGFPSQHRFKVKGKDLVRERVPVFGIFNQCFSGIQASQSNEDDWVFGNLWFLSNYMSLNLGGRQIGIAPSSRPEEEE
ncbi:hypothetical protein BG004_003204 [Podila humilis]|nr:hypothetical protein BG004_003204 [Podila humilis]